MLRVMTVFGLTAQLMMIGGCDEPRSARPTLPAYDWEWEDQSTNRYETFESGLEYDVAGGLSGEFGSYLEGSTDAPSLSVYEFDGVTNLELVGRTNDGAAMAMLNYNGALLSQLVPGAKFTLEGDSVGFEKDIEVIGCTGPELHDWTEDFPASSINIAVAAHPEEPHVSLVNFTAHFDPDVMKRQVLRSEREFYANDCAYESYDYDDDYMYDCLDADYYQSLTDEEILSYYEFPDRPMHITGSFVIINSVKAF